MPSPTDIRPPRQEWITMEITNAMKSEIIVVGNPTLYSGEFLNDYPTRDHTHGTVHNRTIYPGMTQDISAHASMSCRGTTGTIPLYEASRLIGSLSWDCPGEGRQNSVQESNMNCNYSISIGSFRTSGPIGDVEIKIKRA